MKNIKNYAQLWQGCQALNDVARAFFCNYARNEKCVQQFQLKIVNTPKMYQELLDAEFSLDDKFITPIQLGIIVSHWGYPEHLHNMAQQEQEKQEKRKKNDNL